mmetsp:Transcript_30869/g.50130  ORF Transcript_30869/g.50130 Transcript_30869/m.50130 type:complete len:479 (-) Transcript_30869:132-1568(-)
MSLFKINDCEDDDVDSKDIDSKAIEAQAPTPPVRVSFTASKNIFLWLDDHLGQHYVACFGQPSYSFAEPGDLIVAYNYNRMDKSWFSWVLQVNKLSPSQFLWIQSWVNPTFKDLANDEFFVRQLAVAIDRDLEMNPDTEIRVRLFWEADPYMQRAVGMIKKAIRKKNLKNITLSIASKEWADVFANKSCLHRFMASVHRPSAFERCGCFDDDGDGALLSECSGYICTSKAELLSAYDKLTSETGQRTVVIKDCFGVAGDNISFFDSKQKIVDEFVWCANFKYVAMEEDLRHNQQAVGKIEFVGISFHDNKIIGGGHEQIILNGTQFGGSKTYSNKAMERRLKQTAEKVMRKIGTKFMGGFDFAVQMFADKSIEPKVYLIDMNTARYTSTTQTFVVMKKHGIESKYFIRKLMKIKKSASFGQLSQTSPEMLFDPIAKTGAYFHLFHPDKQLAVVTIFGNDEKDACEKLQQLYSIQFLCE